MVPATDVFLGFLGFRVFRTRAIKLPYPSHTGKIKSSVHRRKESNDCYPDRFKGLGDRISNFKFGWELVGQDAKIVLTLTGHVDRVNCVEWLPRHHHLAPGTEPWIHLRLNLKLAEI